MEVENNNNCLIFSKSIVKPIKNQSPPTIVRAISKPVNKIISRKTTIPANIGFNTFIDLDNSSDDLNQVSKNL